jgi:hypothetical protein
VFKEKESVGIPPEDSQPAASSALVVLDSGGALVSGDEQAVIEAVAQIKAIGHDSRTTFSGNLADLVGVTTTIRSLIAQHGEYVRLTERSVALLREYGPSMSPTGEDTIWSFVRDGHQFAGNLDFRRAPLGPEQALALQTAGATLALRAAIHEIEVALERVESKIDALSDMMRAEHIGDVLGTRAMLRPVVERIHNDGKLSETDWNAVDSIGKDAARDVERLRAHLRSQLRRVDQGWRTGQRAEAATELVEEDGLLRETLALLVLAEENVNLWQQIRIFHVQLDEPEHLPYTLDAAQDFLGAATQEDQRLLEELRGVVASLTEPRSLDGLAPWQHRELTAARTQLGDLCSWFADRRSLELEPIDSAQYPSLRESAKIAGRATSYVLSRSARAAANTTKQLRRRGSKQLDAPDISPPELEQ